MLKINNPRIVDMSISNIPRIIAARFMLIEMNGLIVQPLLVFNEKNIPAMSPRKLPAKLNVSSVFKLE
jgi:hypothetical protein